VHHHERDGQSREVLHVADQSLEDRDRGDPPPPAPAHPGARCRESGRAEEGHEQPCQRGVGAGHDERVEGEPVRGVGVARMGTGPGRDDAGHQHERADRHEGGHKGRHRRRGSGGCAVGLVEADEQVRAQRHEGEGEVHVRADDRGVEVREHGQPADDRLRGDEGQHRPGEAPEYGRTGAHRLPAVHRPQHGQRDRHQEERDQPVPELHQRVERHLLVQHRRERARLALRPRRAAEPRSGDAHETAGDDDADLRREVRDHEAVGDGVGEVHGTHATRPSAAHAVRARPARSPTRRGPQRRLRRGTPGPRRATPRRAHPGGGTPARTRRRGGGGRLLRA